MNATCATCNKVVYPVDKLTAINQSFHKLCFKCTECSLVLNLKSFQSFEQKPYCKTHLPRPEHKGVGADSAEMARIKGVSNIQSNLVYKAEFEKQKGDQGGFSQAALDAPEIKNSMKAAQQISSIKYKEHLQSAGSRDGLSVAPQAQANRAAASAAMSTGPVILQETVAAPPQNVYKAAFAYHPDAADELEFEVGDQIVEAQLVAEGWLYGTNPRTGKSGLAPEPYCQKV